ncbi:high affinity immunoglobulin epsilon receptor subunit beta [Cebidichthys violaceus]|uniref:high affinity immunoglobulin epsilon receptor subunit beta n=1 Tax=Cebidichthys violaceus TaxID=271503 RepID=UPI0035CA9DAB
MTSTSVTTVGGVVVVTQVIPKEETGIRLQTATPPVAQAPPTSPASKMDDMTAAFLRGEPRGLGVVQVFLGLLCALFSVTSSFSPILILHAPLSLAVTFVVSGSLVVAAARRTSVGRVWASLVSNLISVLLGLVGVAYVCWLLADGPTSKLLCDSDPFSGFVLSEAQQTRCRRNLFMVDLSVYGLLGLLLVLLVLQVCVSVTVTVFSVTALRRRDRFTLEVGAASEFSSDVSLLGSV